MDPMTEEDNCSYSVIERIPKKSAMMSTEVRKKGNQLYVSKSHDKKTHLTILSLYTESIALAEDDSEELALAYSNRSALLMHLGKYEECLVDIERAHQLTESIALRIKLLTRKFKCVGLVDSSEKQAVAEDDAENLESYVSGNPSESIPCAYDCITLDCNEKYGRHCVATRDIEPGRIVAIENSLVLYPKRDKTYLNCSHCLVFACTGIPCKFCPVAIYCSEKCREEAWSQYHDIECFVLPSLKSLDNKLRYLTTLLVAVRLFIKSIKKKNLFNIINDVDKIDCVNSKGTCAYIHISGNKNIPCEP